MLKNYFLVAIRYMLINRSHSIINTFGLSIGLASCLIIYFHVNKELSFDNFHKKGNRIFRVTDSFERSSGTRFYASTPPALAPEIKNSITGVEKVTRLRYADDHIYAVGDRTFSEGKTFFADSAFFQIFDFKLKAGNRGTALTDPNTIVITEQMANKYFGDEDALGKSILFDNDQQLLVTGILESVPENSHLIFNMLISFKTFSVPDGYLADLNSWGWIGFHTYILMTPNADFDFINNQILEIYNQNYKRPDVKVKSELQPLASIYLESERFGNVGEFIRIGNRSTILSLSIVSLLILVISCFNFMNMSTALSLNRGKEIGIRKVMGASRSKIAYQFLVETVVISLTSLIIALSLILLSRPYFQGVLDIEVPTFFELMRLLPVLILATLIIGLLSGLYPSLTFSSFAPITALKEHLKTGKMGAVIRNGLVLFQFTISILLIAASLITNFQIDFIRNKSLGFDKENIVKIQVLNDDMPQYYPLLKNRYEQLPQVIDVAMASHSFDDGSSSGPARLVGAPEEESFLLSYYQVDDDFQQLTGIELVDGRFFSKDFSSDSSAILLNETAVAEMGLEEPIGRKVSIEDFEKTVIGVVKDFHFNSLHADITPMAIIKPYANLSLVLVRVAPGNVRETLARLENSWKEIVGNVPFDATFLDDSIQKMYEKEEKTSSLISLFSILAVILSCLGLYGLISFSIHLKLKEVSIRKVLGANINQLIIVLGKKFVLLTVLAAVLAIPLIYISGNLWLDNFAYRISISWWIYGLSGLILISIVALTISRKIIETALRNPVSVLNNH